MPNLVSSLFRIYDEYKSACENIINNINTVNFEYLVTLVDVKGKILKEMLIQEKVVQLSDEEKTKQKEIKLQLLEIEKHAQEVFKNRYEEIKSELSKVKKTKKILNKYNPNTYNLGRRVDISQ